MNANPGAALVTGAATGIGAAVSKRLGEEGFELHLLDIDGDGVQRQAESLRQSGVEVATYVVDLADAGAIEATLGRVFASASKLTAVVNNAGIGVAGDVTSTSRDDWHRVFAVNVSAVYEICRLVVPVLAKSGGGSIVNVASVAGLVGIRRRAAYCASKGAVIALTRAMAADHAAEGIRVNAVCPGTVETGWIDNILRGEADPIAARRMMELRQLLGRLGRPEEIAAAVAFLVSDASSFSTGSCLVVDGGMTAI